MAEHPSSLCSPCSFCSPVPLSMRIIPHVSLLPLVTVTTASIQNITIDDANGDEVTGEVPSYYGNGWNARSASTPCTGCVSQPDGQLFWNHTWHDQSAAYSPDASPPIPSNFSFRFSGKSVWIYCTLPGSDIKASTRLQFYLDNNAEPDSTFDYVPPDGSTYAYNQAVYGTTSLLDGEHTMLVSNLVSQESLWTLLLFDYAVYQRDISPNATSPQSEPSTSDAGSTPTSTSQIPTSIPSSYVTATTAQPYGNEDGGRSSPTAAGVRIGGAVGGVFAAAIAIGILSWWGVRRRRKRKSLEMADMTPYPTATQKPPFASAGIARSLMTTAPALEQQKAPSPTSSGQSTRAVTDGTVLLGEMARMREDFERLRSRIDGPPQYDHVRQ
ncbi:hypothetical protein EXIGLDRAFT_733472 [Exidia glandulosa HHB12029]|uniref:Uncharacterized protein n=1 Tax=Exidia glandulosa HHB12029 TaxID=1314781 RepID=A0A165KH57_EXIGL|nr:hypothetical protein EXIGLDRAFT_733472 [Exidia glandulosa HHB12029]